VTAKRNWFVERRLDYIDWMMVASEGIHRFDLMRTFGISMPQASADLNLFLRLYPGAMTYDKSAKVYVPEPGYKPRRGMTIRIPPTWRA
jgi:hypothetical protein